MLGPLDPQQWPFLGWGSGGVRGAGLGLSCRIPASPAHQWHLQFFGAFFTVPMQVLEFAASLLLPPRGRRPGHELNVVFYAAPAVVPTSRRCEWALGPARARVAQAESLAVGGSGSPMSLVSLGWQGLLCPPTGRRRERPSRGPLRAGRCCPCAAPAAVGAQQPLGLAAMSPKPPRAGWKAAPSPLRLPSSHLARCCLEQNQTRGPVLRPLCSSHPSISITCSFRYPAM